MKVLNHTISNSGVSNGHVIKQFWMILTLGECSGLIWLCQITAYSNLNFHVSAFMFMCVNVDCCTGQMFWLIQLLTNSANAIWLQHSNCWHYCHCWYDYCLSIGQVVCVNCPDHIDEVS